MAGFYIKELRVTGAGKKDAIIKFKKGLNIINGPSNTGKSFVFKCIDYMMGAGKIKEVKEGKGYENIYLEFRRYKDESPFTIFRTMQSNNALLDNASIRNFSFDSAKKIKVKHDADKNDNISKVLLSEIGINDNKVLMKNKSGEKKTLGFRAVANLTLINETDIISEEKSPIHNGRGTDNTYCKSYFRYLLTRVDDVLCEEIEKSEIRKAKIEAKIDYVKNEIDSYETEISEIKEFIKIESESEGLKIDDHLANVKEFEEMLTAKLTAKNTLMVKKEMFVKEMHELVMMLNKFQILKKQLKNDINRLVFVEEGTDCINQILVLNCPLCNSEISEIPNMNDEILVEAYEYERNSILKHLEELNKTIKSNSEIKANIDLSLKEATDELILLEDEVEYLINEKIIPLKDIIDRQMHEAEAEVKLELIKTNMTRKKRELIVFEEEMKRKQEKLNYNTEITEEIFAEYLGVIVKTLIDWGCTDDIKITYDEKEEDLKIGGYSRRSNGKGYRAYYYSAMVYSLMEYLICKEMPFSKILILDSPLTTLKEDEIQNKGVAEGDIIKESLQEGMFKSLADNCGNKQVIIIENKVPPNEIEEKSNIIKFTKNSSLGRYGFFPL